MNFSFTVLSVFKKPYSTLTYPTKQICRRATPNSDQEGNFSGLNQWLSLLLLPSSPFLSSPLLSPLSSPFFLLPSFLLPTYYFPPLLPPSFPPSFLTSYFLRGIWYLATMNFLGVLLYFPMFLVQRYLPVMITPCPRLLFSKKNSIPGTITHCLPVEQSSVVVESGIGRWNR